MIVFAQSATEKRLDAWADGELADSTSQDFHLARERLTKLGLSRHPIRLEHAEIRLSPKLVRIDFTGLADSAGRPSPIILGLTPQELKQDTHHLVTIVETGISAIGRQCPSENIHSAVHEALNLTEAISKRQRNVVIACAIAAVLVAIGVFAFAQTSS